MLQVVKEYLTFKRQTADNKIFSLQNLKKIFCLSHNVLSIQR